MEEKKQHQIKMEAGTIEKNEKMPSMTNTFKEKNQGSRWRQEYNEMVLQQRVKEALEKQHRYEELKQRGEERAERARQLALKNQLDTIRDHYSWLRMLAQGSAKQLYRCFMPFGKPLLIEQTTIGLSITVGSHGYLGVWKHPEKADTDPYDMQPTLVDYSNILRETSSEEHHIITSSCVCKNRDGTLPALEVSTEKAFGGPNANRSNDKGTGATETFVVFSTTYNGKGAVALVTLTNFPRMLPATAIAEEDIQRQIKQRDLFKTDPAKAIRDTDMDLESQGFRWIPYCEVICERFVATGLGKVTDSLYSPVSETILIFGGNSVKSVDLRLKALWVCDLDTLLPKELGLEKPQTELQKRLSSPDSKRDSKRSVASVKTRAVTAVVPFDEYGTGFFIGTEFGEVLLLAIPSEDIIKDRFPPNVDTDTGFLPGGEIWEGHLKERAARRNRNDSGMSNIPPELDRVITTSLGVKYVLLAKYSSPVTSISPHSDTQLFVGCKDGSITQFSALTRTSPGFLPKTIVDESWVAGENGAVRSVRVVNNRGKPLIYATDALGHIRCFSEDGLISYSSCAQSNLFTVKEVTKIDGSLHIYALADHSWSVWKTCK